MAITISGENNNDKILASDGVIDQISGINIVGLITASHINVGSNINLGNAGIVTATTFVGNLTGNVNSTSPLLLQTGGSERIRITSNNEIGIAGANYGTAGQVLTSGGSGSAVTWSAIPSQVTIANNADNRIITGGSGVNLNGEANLTFDGTTLNCVAGVGPQLRFENQHSVTTDAVISTFDDASGTLLCLGSNFYINSSGAETRYNTSEESTGIILNRQGYINLNTGGTGTNARNRIQITETGKVQIGLPGNAVSLPGAVEVVNIRAMTDGNLCVRAIGSIASAPSGSGVGIDVLNDANNTVKDLALRGSTIIFKNASDESARIDSSGRLLISTTSAGEADSTADDLVIGNTGSGNSGLTIVTGTGNNAAVFCADSGGTVRGGFRYQHSTDNLQFYSGGSVSLQVKSNAIGLHENYPIANSITIRGAATDDTPSLVLKRHTDGAQGDGEVIGRIQFMSNENNVDSGNHHTRAEIRAETQSTSGASRLEFYTVPNSTIATSLAATINGTQDFMIGTQNPDEGGAGLGFNARGFIYRPSGHAVVRSASSSISGASGICYTAKFADTGTGKAFRVMLAQTEIGSIGMGAGGTTFNTSSDYRRKENIINLTGAITRLKTLIPKRFNFKDEPSVTRDGFLAHEVTAVPEAITGTKDQVDSNNEPVYQQMDQSKIIPLLTAALQEAITEIETLKTKVSALEGS